jgi:hypothetical protein
MGAGGLGMTLTVGFHLSAGERVRMVTGSGFGHAGPWAIFWVGLKGILGTFCLFFSDLLFFSFSEFLYLK